MTVAELIAKLKEMPQDAKVWTEGHCHSCFLSNNETVDIVSLDIFGDVVLKERVEESCCDNEDREFAGGCRNCGDPSY